MVGTSASEGKGGERKICTDLAIERAEPDEGRGDDVWGRRREVKGKGTVAV